MISPGLDLTKNYTLAARTAIINPLMGLYIIKTAVNCFMLPTKETGLGLTADCKEVDLVHFSHYIGI